MFRTLKSRFSMKIIGYNFTDKVSGKLVFDAVDCYGDVWMVESTNPFTFRVKKEQQK